jgi:hypothetical protein
MEGNQLFSVARSLKDKWKGQRTFLLESSGNITEANLRERAINGKLDGQMAFTNGLSFFSSFELQKLTS